MPRRATVSTKDCAARRSDVHAGHLIRLSAIKKSGAHCFAEPSRSAALDRAVLAARPGRAGKAAYGKGRGVNQVRLGTSSRSGELTSEQSAQLVDVSDVVATQKQEYT